jgi:hypothetical protein
MRGYVKRMAGGEGMDGCNHDGLIYEVVRCRYWVVCQVCGKWRFRKWGDVFWKVTFTHTWGILDKDRMIKVTTD